MRSLFKSLSARGLDRPLQLTVVRYTVSYILLSLLWIVLTDRLVGLWSRDLATATLLATIKGWFFVAVTALFWHGVMVHNSRRIMEESSGKDRAESALEESETRFRTALLHAPIPVMIHSEDGTVVLLNHEWTRITGYTAEAIPTIDAWMEKAYGARKDEVRAHINRVRLTAGSVEEAEYIITTQSGEQRSWHFSARSLGRQSDGRNLVISAALDVTERRRAEEMLREREEQYRELYDQSPVGYQSLDAEGRFLTVNRAWLDVLGYRQEEVIGKWFGDFLAPEFVEAFRKRFPQFIAAGKIHSEFEMIRKDGARRHVAFDGRIAHNADGSFRQTHCILQDVTEQRLAQQQIIDSERRFRTLFENTPLAYQSLDESGRFIDVNGPLCELLGRSRDELLGRPFGDFWSEETRHLFPEKFAELTRTGEITNAEIALTPRNEQPLTVLLSGRVQRDPATGAFVRTHCILHDISERKRVEQALRQNEHLLKLFVEHSPAAIAMLDRNMRYLVASRRWFVDYELTDTDIIGRSHYDVFPEIPERWKQIHQRCLAGAVERCDVDAFPRQDGHTDWVHWEIHPWKAVDGTIGGIIIFSELISDRIKADAALRDAENRYRSLFEQSPYGILVVEPTDGRHVEFNSVAHEQLGYTREEFSTMGLADYEDIESPAELHAHIAQVLRTGKDAFETRHRTKRGELRTVHVTVQLFEQQGRQMLHCIFRDITEQRLAQATVLESERRFREVLSNLPTAAVVLDKDARITYCNEFLLTLTGWTVSEVLGREWFDMFVPPEVRESVREVFQRALRNDNLPIHYENEISTRDGARRLIAWTNTALYDEQGRIISTASIGEDITNRRKAELERAHLQKQLIQSQRLEAIGTLSSGIAHDFNNILNIILGNANLLAAQPQDAERQQHRIQSLTTAAERGAELVKQLLTFARKTAVDRQSMDVNGLLQELVKLMSETFPKSITLTLNLEPQLPRIDADPNQVHQVLLNMCVNARDAMPDGGTLTLATAIVRGETLTQRFSQATPASYVRVTIRDTGSGIREEHLREIFNPFFTTKDIGKGTGLGLAVAYGIVENHAGFIDVTSTPGVGTEFTVYLPAAQQVEAAAAEPVGTYLNHVPGGTETILFVDDEPLAREMAVEHLQNKGYTVLTAGDGEEALAVFRANRERIGLVLSDYGLPKLDGEEVLRRIRAMDPTVPFLLMSGFVEPEKVKDLERQGVDGIVQKPFAATRLLMQIRDVLDGATRA